jgi:hypothetical protein
MRERKDKRIMVRIIVLALIVFSYTILATKPEGKDREADRVKKKYGGWIVDTVNLPSHADDRVIPLNSLEDLIKVAEETGKPVIHKMSTTSKGGAYVSRIRWANTI